MSQQTQTMKTVQVTLQNVRDEAPGVKSLLFEYDKNNFQYKPGQIVLLFPEEGNPNLRHAFSIASSPTEDFLMISTKIRDESPYKTRLNHLKQGDVVSLMGPAGQFGLTEQSTDQIVLLGGGIGITPFRSIVKYATDKKLPNKITLLYSNKTPEDIVYKHEWEEYEERNANFIIVHTITQPSESKPEWKGRVGRIDANLIREQIKNPEKAQYYVCGPPSLVTDLTSVLTGMGISGTQIRTENFRGYAD
jgi:ferredoxin-NADP reductase